VNDDKTVEVSFPSKLGYERIAMECSASLARIVGLAQDRIEDLKTAVSEACINAIEHGNKGRPESRVVVSFNVNADTFWASVKDEGTGITEFPQELNIEQKVEKLEPPNGLGVYLIKNLVDEVEFNQTTKEGHVVKMGIRLRR
jgi:serine/threonine-protein kinase RsbW